MCRKERSHNHRLYVHVYLLELFKVNSVVLGAGGGARGEAVWIRGVRSGSVRVMESAAKCCHVETDTGSYAVHNVLRETTFTRMTHTEITGLVSLDNSKQIIQLMTDYC